MSKEETHAVRDGSWRMATVRWWSVSGGCQVAADMARRQAVADKGREVGWPVVARCGVHCDLKELEAIFP